MSITIDSGGMLLIIFAIIFAAVIISMLLKRGDFKKKTAALVILIVTFGFVFLMFGRPAEITVNENGIESTTYGKIAFRWNEVEKAVLIDNYQDTGFKPTLKLNGTAAVNFRAGTFKLSNGDKVKLITQSSGDAAIFYTDKDIYLIAIDELPALIDIAGDYIVFE